MGRSIGGTGGPDPTGKSQIICFLSNTGMDPPREALGLLEGGPYGPL